VNKAATELCDHSAVDALSRCKNCEISALELFDSCVRRIESVNLSVNAVVASDVDAVLLRKQLINRLPEKSRGC